MKFGHHLSEAETVEVLIGNRIDALAWLAAEGGNAIGIFRIEHILPLAVELRHVPDRLVALQCRDKSPSTIAGLKRLIRRRHNRNSLA